MQMASVQSLGSYHIYLMLKLQKFISTFLDDSEACGVGEEEGHDH